jgi:CBS domain-containing protein
MYQTAMRQQTASSREEMTMQVRDTMSRNFESIPLDATIRTAANQMRELDVGMLPVEEKGEVVGTVTDRDITIRGTAIGSDPATTPVSAVMSHEIFTCLEEDDLHEAARIMEEHQIRRLMVQDNDGRFVGVLALADIARQPATDSLGAEVLHEVSQAETGAGAATH